MTEEEFSQKQTELLSRVPERFRGWLSYMAWRKGHAYGLDEVISLLEDYVDGLAECLSK